MERVQKNRNFIPYEEEKNTVRQKNSNMVNFSAYQRRNQQLMKNWEFETREERTRTVREERRAVNAESVPVRRTVRQRPLEDGEERIVRTQHIEMLRKNEAGERQARMQRRKRRRRRVMLVRGIVAAIGITLVILLGVGLFKIGSYIFSHVEGEGKGILSEVGMGVIQDVNQVPKPEIEEVFLTPNPYSRPGEALTDVNNIFIHYTANKGTSAEQNRSYFENLAATGETSASAHFVIGYDGKIIQCIPLDEIAYAVKEHNYDSVSIECCYLDESGQFTQETYQSLLALTAWLMGEYNLTTEDVLRHYDASGKLCPKYYVEQEGSWEKLLKDVETYAVNA